MVTWHEVPGSVQNEIRPVRDGLTGVPIRYFARARCDGKPNRVEPQIIPFPTGRIHGLAVFQALRARLPSCRPSGTIGALPQTLTD